MHSSSRDRGGGGAGVVCKDSQGIESIEVLDLFEGQNRYGLAYRPSTGNLLRDYQAATVRRWRLEGDDRIWDDEDTKIFLLIMSTGTRFLKPGETLPVLNDVGPLNLPQNCQLVQIAIQNDEPLMLDIDRSLWDRLSARSQAALITHEDIWTFARNFGRGFPNSTLSRLQTAISFSDEPLPPINFNIAKHVVNCFAIRIPETGGVIEDYTIALWQEVDHTVIQLFRMAGANLITDTRFELPVTGLRLDSSGEGPLHKRKTVVISASSDFEGVLTAKTGELSLPGTTIQLYIKVSIGQEFLIGTKMPGFEESLLVNACRAPAEGS